nr:MAG TPA_asm: hypothetical protein [Caudoviricetes sp.]
MRCLTIIFHLYKLLQISTKLGKRRKLLQNLSFFIFVEAFFYIFIDPVMC